jgi:hypothetical protein
MPISLSGSLNLSGSLTTTGTITATTLVVQTITSSISSITGSTNFGLVIGNTHMFTGSMSVSGSGTFAGSATIGNAFTIQGGTGLTKHYFTSAGPGDALNQLYDNTGTVKVQLYTNGVSYLNGGNVGIRTTAPQASLHIAGLADQNALTIGTSNAYEIFITGSDSANIYHASPNQAIYLNTNGGPLYLGTSSASTLLTVTGSSVGIGATNPGRPLEINYAGPGLRLRYNADNYMDFESDFMNQVSSGPNSWQFQFNGSSLMQISSNGNVGIGTTNPSATLQVRGPNATGIFFDAQNIGAGGAVFSRINASSFPYNQYLFNNGYVGIGTSSPLSKLNVNGTINATELDAPNRQTIIKSSGIAGTLYGTLTISVPTMTGGAGSIGYGGFSCEVYVAGYSGMYCHAWFSGYVNGGITPSESAILRSNGGWSVSMSDNGAQGQTFTIDLPSAGIIHPTARIIWNKGGSNNSAGTDGELITATWS